MASMRSRSRRGVKCLRPGPIMRNPYLNFLREYRKKCCGLSAIKTVQEGAKAWNRLTQAQKRRYEEKVVYARNKSRMSNRRSSRRTSRRRTGRKRASRSRSRSRSRTARPIIKCSM